MRRPSFLLFPSHLFMLLMEVSFLFFFWTILVYSRIAAFPLFSPFRYASEVFLVLALLFLSPPLLPSEASEKFHFDVCDPFSSFSPHGAGSFFFFLLFLFTKSTPPLFFFFPLFPWPSEVLLRHLQTFLESISANLFPFPPFPLIRTDIWTAWCIRNNGPFPSLPSFFFSWRSVGKEYPDS